MSKGAIADGLQQFCSALAAAGNTEDVTITLSIPMYHALRAEYGQGPDRDGQCTVIATGFCPSFYVRLYRPFNAPQPRPEADGGDLPAGDRRDVARHDDEVTR